MTSTPFAQHPGATLLALLLGLALSFAFRRRPWVFFIWLPTTGVFAYVTYQILRIFSAIGKMSGPDAGFAGMMGIFLIPALVVCLVGMVAAFFCRPRKEAWRLSTAIPAAIFWLGVAMLIDFGNSTRVEIQLLDAKGNALAGVGINEVVRENGLKMKPRTLKSNDEGKFSCVLHTGQAVALEIQPMGYAPESYERKPTFWNLGIRETEGQPDKLVLNHHWQRSIGGQTLNEGFSEVIPNASKIQMELVLPDHGSLEPEPRQKRVRDAFHAFVNTRPPELTYSSVCRNVESIEFIPDLIEAFQTEQDKSGAIDGLAQIAGILRQLGRPAIPQLVEAILKHPPKDNQAKYAYHHTLWMLGAKLADLAPLYASDDPAIVMTAFEATPNSQLEGSIAAKALSRLEAVYPNISEELKKRAEMHMDMLRARLAPPE